MKVTMIGHSTVLVETSGMRILTDPYFGSRGNLAFARSAPPARNREELKDVDLVLVSHNHWDHTDRRFFRSLAAQVPVIAPRAAVWITRCQGAKNVTGLGNWEERQFGPVRITAVPALHLALPCGFVIEAEGKRVYFAGDTYYGRFMTEIGARFKPDLALMPVTTFRIPMTMGESGAARAVKALSPKIVIPIHLGIVPRSPLLRTKDSPEGFSRRMQRVGVGTRMTVLREGASLDC